MPLSKSSSVWKDVDACDTIAQKSLFYTLKETDWQITHKKAIEQTEFSLWDLVLNMYVTHHMTLKIIKNINEYNPQIPQSHIADQHMTPGGRAIDPYSHKTQGRQ